jgi:hypothetical protein
MVTTSLLLILPMNAIDRAGVNGLLDFVCRRAPGIEDLGEPQGVVESEDLRTDFYARAAGDTLFFHDKGEVVRHNFLLLVFLV